MPAHADLLRLHLARKPSGARQLLEKIGVSQPTLSAMGDEVVCIGAALSIHTPRAIPGTRAFPEHPVASARWPVIAEQLAGDGHITITRASADGAALLKRELT